ncbi:MAG TPA: multicopper oxidase domain-containing protein, partial [Caldilinea sp.]|nr:multicopper oxidase domain-containing protein [Caldilinea sp.]
QVQNGVLTPATTQAVSDACTDPGAPQRSYNVSAIFVRMTLNRFGDNDPGAAMYVLTENIPALRAEEAARQVTTGLRSDLIQPLVIRANLGECVTINFTNQLNRAASFHVQSLAYTVNNAGGMVGNNPDTFAAANGGTRTYRISMPPANDPRGEGAYYFYSHGAARALTSHGLFGALVAEPPGSTYLHAMTGQPLTSGWEAIIVDPNGSNFREFTLLWHEIGDEKADIFDATGNPLPVLDQAISGAYRPGSRAMNYRSEPFMDRLLLQQANGQEMDKALAYSSYTFGDPATPMPRSYLGEPTKTRLVHAGSEMFHVYHLHGGGTRWRRNPFADDRGEFDQGLKKSPTQDAFSIRLDSQSIAPSESFTLEHECAAGGCQQTAGDYLFHCHIGPHYVAGMWSFWRVYDTIQPDLAVIPTRAPAPAAVNSLGLIGTVVEGRTLLPAAQITDPNTQISIEDWARRLFPAQGVPFDELDAAVWDWTIDYVNGDPNQPLVLGEPETTFTWVNYTPRPGTRPDRRPEIMFNPTNARYAWPVLRPHLGRRPPFASNQHGGAPWAGETATAARPDGMCPDNAPNNRFYPVTAIQKRLEIKPNAFDDNGMLFVLNEDKQAVVAGTKQAEPLVLRSNVGDCVDVVLTSSLEDARAFHTYSKVNLHIHFVQFDPQASDGVISGMSFEQSVRPYTTELSAPGALAPVGRTLVQAAAAGATQIAVSDASRLHVGGAFGIGLDRANIEIRTITAVDTVNNTVTLDQPLAQNHESGEPVGVEFVRYRWYSDVDSGTVFYHSHVTFTDWYHGLIGAHIIEPAGSTYHNPLTGQPIRSGTVADIRTTGVAGNTSSGPWPPGAPGTERGFREYVVFFTADSPANGASGGTINLRASPFATRGTDPGRIFSSVTNNDPFTPLFRAYLGDPVMIRGMSVVEKEGALRITGHRFRLERFASEGVQMDTAGIDISERYDLILEGGAGGIQQRAGDYLYYTTIMEQFIDGAWGLMRVYDRQRNDLQVLPGRPAPPTGPGGFPQQQPSPGSAPIPASDPGAVCPANAPLRSYEAVIFRQPIPYSPANVDLDGVVYALADEEAAIRAGTLPARPLVLRTNVGECLEIGLTNKLLQSASLHAGELTYDPQGSYGAAIGFNTDSTVAPGARRVYRYYADQDVGITLFYNLANPTTAARGAFGAIIVEPAGSIYRNPLDGTTTRSGIVADIITPQGSFREYVGLLSDEDDVIGQNQMPYPTVVQGFTGLNYVAEAFADRLGVNADPALVFASPVHGDPANLLQAHLGDAVRLRVGKPWGTQGQVFGIEGHRWPLEPNMAGSNLIASKSFRSGEAFDMLLHDGAGGQAGAPGDYFFGDMRAPFQEAGVWGLLRVLPGQATGVLPLPAPGVMLDATNTASAAQIYLNSPVTFAYQVRNRGTVALTGVNVTDSACATQGGTLTQTGNGNGDAILDAGEIWSYTCTVTPAATITNRMTVTALDGAGATVTAAATAGVSVVNPQIALARPAPAAQVQAGQPIAFAYAVSVPAGGVGSLSNVVVTDDACTAPTRTGGDTNNNNVLEVGETWLYACTVTLNANVQSTATATAVDSFGAQVAAVVPLAIEVLPASIQLSVQPSVTSATVGTTVNYNYTVTNNGSAPLNNVTVTDSLFGAIT